MIFELAQDLSAALAALPDTHPRRSVLQLLREGVERDIHFISRHPTTLFQCMWNLCWWYDCPQRTEYYEPVQECLGQETAARQGTEAKLSALMESWRCRREKVFPGFVWVRSLRPPAAPLGGRLVRVLEGRGGPTTSIAWSGDGLRIAAGGDGVRVWDVATGEILRSFDDAGEVCSVAISPDGTRVLCGSYHGTVDIFDVERGSRTRGVSAHTKGAVRMALSPDGLALLSGADDGVVRVSELPTGAEKLALSVSSTIRDVAFSPDGRRIAAVDFDGVRVWDASSGAKLRDLSGHGAVAFSPDGHSLACGSRPWVDTCAGIVWGGRSDDEPRAVLGTSGKCYSLGLDSIAWSPDGRLVATTGQGDPGIRVWDVCADAEDERFCRGDLLEDLSASFSPDGKLLAGAASDGSVSIWNVSRATPRGALAGHTRGINRVAYSPDGRELLTTSFDSTIRYWDAFSGKPTRSVERETVGARPVYGVSFSPSGNLVAGGTSGGLILIWEHRSGNMVRSLDMKLQHVSSQVLSVEWSSDERTILAGLSDGSAGIWDAVSGECVARFSGHDADVQTVAFSPDQRFVASGSEDRTVRAWDAHVGEELQCLRGHQQGVINVAYSRDGRVIVSGSWDGTVRVWDTKTWLCVDVIQGEGDVRAIAAGKARYPHRLLAGDVEMVLEDAARAMPIAWFPSRLVDSRSHPNNLSWAGAKSSSRSQGSHLHIIALEGFRRRTHAHRTPWTTVGTH